MKKAAPSDGNVKIVPLFDNTMDKLTCSADFQSLNKNKLPILDPLTVRFKIVQTIPFGQADKDGKVPQQEQPIAGVGFEPVLFGDMARDKTNPEHLTPDGRPSPARFVGVVTPEAEWCSDTCGVMTYEFWPNCHENSENEIRARIVAGGIQTDGDSQFVIKITHDQ